MLDSPDQTAFHAGCTLGAFAVSRDVFHLLQENSSQDETCICSQDKIIKCNRVGKTFPAHKKCSSVIGTAFYFHINQCIAFSEVLTMIIREILS